jgi:SPP1 gp7 family putative phage head morphogenesis protein
MSTTSRSTDPTRTQTLRRKYASRLRAEFGDINTQIRAGIADRDVLGLRNEALAAPLPSQFPRRQDRQIETFSAWLDRQLEQGPLETISRGENTYVRSAYSRGYEQAATELRKRGVDVSETDLGETFNRGVRRETLQTIYTRDYSDLEGITAEVSKQSTRALTNGLVEGQNPRTIARSITDRVDKIGKTRATALARTSVIDAYAAGSLDRYERLGVSEVTGNAEVATWLTAGDARVCPECRALGGNTYTLDEARGKIPQHVRCRCTWLPVV